jgi:acetyl esterase/lipase
VIRDLSWNVLLRATLTSIAVVVLALPALAVTGGYLPILPWVERFGRLLISDLPVFLLGSIASSVLAIAALRLGGGRFAALVAFLSLLTLAGAAGIAARYGALAEHHGATYDLTRAAQQDRVPGQPDARLEFARVDGQGLSADVWRAPAGAPPAPVSGRTAVLFVHGGAFSVGGLGSRPALFEQLASAGFPVFDVEYRLAPPPRWSDAPADVLCALGWLQASAGEFGIDPGHIVVMGESAGGSLALVAGYAAGSNALEPSCPVATAPPAGVVAIAPTADLAGIWASRTLEVDGLPFPEAYIGGPPSAFPDRYEAASPLRLIRAGLPRTLLLAGATDHLVPVAGISSLADRLTAAGVECELVVVPFADHGFDGPPDGFGAQLEETIFPSFLGPVSE